MILGLSTEMFIVFVLTILGGSLGAIHYVVVHVLLGKPVAETIRGSTEHSDRRGPDGA